MDFIGKTCPYCQAPIKPGQMARSCEKCQIPHHAECWDDNGGCTTLGCGSKMSAGPSGELFPSNLTGYTAPGMDSAINGIPRFNQDSAGSSASVKTSSKKAICTLGSLIAIIAATVLFFNIFTDAQAKNEYNSGVARLETGDWDGAYFIFFNNGLRYGKTETGTTSAIYAQKIGIIKILQLR